MTKKTIDQGGGWFLRISDEARTAVPFDSEAREDGGFNHPFHDLTKDPWLIALIPEVAEFYFLRDIIEIANRPDSWLMTTACDAKGPMSSLAPDGTPRFHSGGMIVIAYRDEIRSRGQGTLIQLANEIEAASTRPDTDCRVLYQIEPYKSWYGIEDPPHYNLSLEFVGLGSTPEAASAAAERAAKSVASALSKILSNNQQ